MPKARIKAGFFIMKKNFLWFFDLDNTLHNTSRNIFPFIKENMNAFVAKVLEKEGKNADAESVNALRIKYWSTYGATLFGLIKHHQVSMNDFLEETHRFDNLSDLIHAERGLRHFFRKLPGRKILLTNAPHNYAKKVIKNLRLENHFERQIAIESMRVGRHIYPKPSKKLFRHLAAKYRVSPRKTVLVEDTNKTLKAVKSLAWRTVWVTGYLSQSMTLGSGVANFAYVSSQHLPKYADIKVRSVRHLQRNLHKLGKLR